MNHHLPLLSRNHPSPATSAQRNAGLRFGGEGESASKKEISRILKFIPECDCDFDDDDWGGYNDINNEMRQYNYGPGRESWKRKVRYHDDFVDLVISKNSPRSTAEIMARFLNDFSMDLGPSRSVLYFLGTVLELPELEALYRTTAKLRASRFFIDRDSGDLQNRFLVAVGRLLSNKSITTAELERLPEKLQALWQPAQKNQSSDHKPMNGQILNERRILTGSLVNQLFSLVLDGKEVSDRPNSMYYTTYATLSPMALLSEVSDAADRFQTRMAYKPEGFRLAGHLLDIADSHDRFKSLSAEFMTTMEAFDANKPFLDALEKLFLGMENPEGLRYGLTMLKDYTALGGPPNFMADLLTDEKNQLRKQTAASLQQQFGGLLQMLEQHRPGRARNTLESVIQHYWPTRPLIAQDNFLDFAGQVTLLHLAMPDSMAPEEKKKVVYALIGSNNARDYKALSASIERVKTLFSGLEEKPVYCEQIVRVLQASDNLERGELARTFLTLADGVLPADLNPVHRKSVLETGIHALFLPDKTGTLSNDDILKVLTGISTLLPRLIEGGPAGSSALVEALRSLDHYRRVDVSSFSTVLEEYLQLFVLLNQQAASRPGERLDTDQIFLQLAGVCTNESDLARRPTVMVDRFPINPAPESIKIQPEKIRKVVDGLKAYQTHVQPPDDLAPFITCCTRVLKEHSLEQWQTILDGFVPVIATIPQEERLEWKEQSNTLPYWADCLAKAAEVTSKGFYQDPFGPFYATIVKTYQECFAMAEPQFWEKILHELISGATSAQDFEESTSALKVLLTEDSAPSPEVIARRRDAMSKVLRKSMGPVRMDHIYAIVDDYLLMKGDPKPLLMFWSIVKPGLSGSQNYSLNLRDGLEILKTQSNPDFIRELKNILTCLRDKFKDPVRFDLVLKTIARLPDHWLETAQFLAHVNQMPDWLGLTPFLDSNKNGPFGNAFLGKTHYTSILKRFEEAMALLSLAYFPTRFMNHYLLHKDTLHPAVLHNLYYDVEYSNFGMTGGTKMVPELLAMIPPYLDSLKQNAFNGQGVEAKKQLDQVSAAITRIYGYIYADTASNLPRIDKLHGIALNNWAKIGTLGLSFTKWQYDAMTRWKGGGPAQKPSLFAQSNHFKPIPPRDNDKTYYGGWLHHDPKTGLSIEMRRAYIVISKPEFGSLVIRNSSPVFGRNLLPEVGFYHQSKIYSDAEHLFNPDEDLKDSKFYSIFSKAMNQESWQVDYHTKIEGLLNAFEEAMEPYVEWKCGFKGGKIPEGFREMLSASLMSAKSDGVVSPFGKKKNIKLAWVNRFGLPHPVSSFNVSDAGNQAEVTYALEVMNRRRTVDNSEAYEQQIPNLLAFLKDGLSKNLELVLTE